MMSQSSSQARPLIFVIALLGATLLAALLYIMHLQREQGDLEEKLILLQWEMTKMEESIEPLQARIEVLERTSIQTLADDANDVLQSGWNTLLGTVSKELKQAKEQWGEVWKELEQMELPDVDSNNPPSASEQAQKPYSPDSASLK